MDGYLKIPLVDMIDELGEDRLKLILSNFSCPINRDVESFIKKTSIEFAKQGIAQTHLVFCQHKGNIELIAYFSLAMKNFTVHNGPKRISKSLKKRLNKFGKYDHELESYIVPAPLIAQLGKNFERGLNNLISGDELLKMACDTVAAGQRLLGGRFVYLECEDKEKIKNFYYDNGFVDFGKRDLEKSERDELKTTYLVQMLRYL